MKLSVLLFLLIACVPAIAQSVFEGFYGQLGIGYLSASPSTSIATTYNSVSVPSSLNTTNSTNFSGVGTLGYTASISKDFVLGVGGEYSPIANQAHNQIIGVLGHSISIGSSQLKNLYNFFFAPGVVVGDNGLVYAKLGYTQMQVNTAVTNHYTGYSLGMGYKQFITGGVYGFGELNYASYGKQTLSQSSTFWGTL